MENYKGFLIYANARLPVRHSPPGVGMLMQSF